VTALASLYIHIPFCEHKCLYCDFYSEATTEPIDAFIVALAGEISLRGHHDRLATYETVFFGGGTPSLLTPQQLEAIFTLLHATFRIASDAEITLEANPGTVNQDSLRAFRSLGVNRLSVGIQSFHDRELSFLGRIHDRVQALRCVDEARGAGFDNIGIDLIYSLPGQTLPEWEDNLRTAIGLHPRHMAAYSLTVEEGTPLARSVQTGAVRPNATELEAAMYERAMDLLAAHRYDHYEISNYAQPGFRCRHNCAYWYHENYLGLGPSAHSFWKARDGRRGRRWCNVADLATYVDQLERDCSPIAYEESVGPSELVHERILLGLRSSGLDLGRLHAELGYDLEAHQGELLRDVVADGLAVLHGRVLRLTSKGYMLCDEICTKLSRSVRSDLGRASRDTSRGD